MIVFLWTKDHPAFGCLQNSDKIACFNFGSEFIFSVINKDGKDILICSKNENYIPEFFTNSQGNAVKNITAIIGKNGVGKSTIISGLYRLEEKWTFPVEDKAILVYKENEEFYLWSNKAFYICKKSKELAKIQSLKKYSLTLTDDLYLYNNIEQALPGMKYQALSQDNMIFYSNIFLNRSDFNGYESAYKNNISIDAIINSRDFKDWLLLKPNENLTQSLEQYLVLKCLNFIYEKEKLGLEIEDLKIPEYIKIGINVDYSETVRLESEKVHRGKDYLEIYHKVITPLKNDYKDDYEDAILTQFFSMLFYHVFIKDGTNHDDDMVECNKIYGRSLKERIMSFFKLYLDENSRIKKNPKSKLILTNGYKFYSSYYQLLIDIIKTNNPKIQSYNNFTIRLKEEKKVLNTIVEGIRLLPDSGFMLIDWKGLSSGEKAMLTFFSMFYTLLDNEEKRKSIKGKEIHILMDEPDYLLHPEWQRKFLNTITNVFNTEIFFKNCNLHLILTSHSPFIASDMPSSNIILLSKDDKEMPIQINPTENYFAANIFDLYKNGFFLNSYIGEYARVQLKEFFDFLKEVDLSKNDAQIIEELRQKFYGEYKKGITFINYFSLISKNIGEKYLKDQIEKSIEFINKKLKS